MMLTCREVSRLYALGAFEEAGTSAKLFAKLHLWICASCRRFKAQMALLNEAVFDIFTEFGPEPARAAGLEKAVLERLKRGGL